MLPPSGTASHAVVVTKSDTTIYSPPLSALYVGGAGNVAVLLSGDTVPVTLTAPPVGTMLTNMSIVQVMATNTTATLLVGFH